MKSNLFLFVFLTCLVLSESGNLLQDSNTCCSQCSSNSFLLGPQTPSKLKDLLTTAISKNWNVTYFVSKFQQFPREYFLQFSKSVSTLDGMVKNGTSSCGGQDLSSYPHQYLPSQFINILYDSIIDTYTLNPSNLENSYAQAMVQLLTSLKNQFNNDYGIPADPSTNDTFISYRQDLANQSTGTVSSNALASSLASSILNSADPLILAEVNYGYLDKVYQYYGNERFIIMPTNRDIALQIGDNEGLVSLDFPLHFQTLQPPYGLRKFTIFADPAKGNPFSSSVINRLGQVKINDISSMQLQVSDSVNAKLTGNLLSGYAYCFFPGLASVMESTCLSSCDVAC